MKARVYLRSKPSPGSEFYRGHVDVVVETLSEAPRVAVETLARGTFRDRGWDAWVIEKVEVLS